ncbi:MAG: UbiA prenyltransferase family protein [Candidatus Bathyarchaeota archaeon]|nr:MAG: UbiA prenyltransferase family protein [Candidatus Bathyarchaeota archaeon]
MGSIIFNLPPFERIAIVFMAFLFVTASVFVLNQYIDREADRRNKVKSRLPVASGRITPRNALIFSILLVILGLTLVFIVDVYLSALFLVYLGLWTAYSTPPFRLKALPVVDFVISGLGAGFLPFFMGLAVTHHLNIDVSSIMLVAIPLTLIHSGGHIIQAVGDCEADSEMRTNTSVVKYGKKKTVIVAGLMILTAVLSPFVYSAFGLLSYRHLLLFFIIFPLSIPVVMRYADVLRDPSTKSVVNLQKTAGKYGTIAIAIVWAYAVFTKIAGF